MTRPVLLVGTNRFDIVRPLAERPDLGVTVLTEPWYAERYRRLGLADVRVVDDIGDHGALVAAAGGPYAAVLAPSERAVLPAAFLRSWYGITGTPFDVALGFTAKHVMKQRLAAAGLPVVPFRVVHGTAPLDAAVADLGFPVIVKPALGTGGSGTVVLAGPDDPAPAAATTVVERLLPVVREFHVDAIVTDGVGRFHSVARYLQPLLDRTRGTRGSLLLPRDDPRRRGLVDLHEAAVTALGLQRGATHLEVLETADGRLLIGEIACRPAGAAEVPCMELGYGFDYWRLFIDLETGAPVEVPAGPARAVGVYVAGSGTDVGALARIPGVVRVAGPTGGSSYGAHVLFEPGPGRPAERIVADLNAARDLERSTR